MKSLKNLARQNRKAALKALAEQRNCTIIRPDFGNGSEVSIPVLDFGARRRACPELASVPCKKAAPAGMPTLVLVADASQVQAA
ncbi:hypothetical protein FHY55_10675 [Oceanicola sp. D3]|uniref:hypothetical protein n=1 Tax=Oceanicola sp. D3 TaxID=2587163 RepID=UPI001123A161|nr:hypothetical protein [Oceanicola sp. D3]QDC09680.1 hypothetical protein FHY55_10675 [Oceanicola sp. D3]